MDNVIFPFIIIITRATNYNLNMYNITTTHQYRDMWCINKFDLIYPKTPARGTICMHAITWQALHNLYATPLQALFGCDTNGGTISMRYWSLYAPFVCDTTAHIIL